MQNWKIKRMSDEELPAQSKAVGSLLYYYLKEKDYPDTCPLCKVGWKFHPKAPYACSVCLWGIIEGEDCEDFAKREFGVLSAGHISMTAGWHARRIPMLRRWKKILKLELVRRKLCR